MKSIREGIKPRHARDHIVRPTLKAMGMWSYAAEHLVLGTIAIESLMGYELVQRGNGPAVGICQMEPATASDIAYRYLKSRDSVDERFQAGFQLVNDASIDWEHVSLEAISAKLITDMRFAVAMCRLRYWMVPEPLPGAGDVLALAHYWKRYYNTSEGRGAVADFIDRYMGFELHALGS